jgi:hypothetical protein
VVPKLLLFNPSCENTMPGACLGNDIVSLNYQQLLINSTVLGMETRELERIKRTRENKLALTSIEPTI